MNWRLFPLVATLFVAAASPHPTQADELPHCYLEASGISDLGELRRIWQASWGSYIGDVFQGKVLKIRVGTTARVGGAATVEVFWIGRSLPSSNLVVYGNEKQNVTVPAAYFAELYSKSPETKNRVVHLVLIGRHSERGLQHDGWIVCVRDAAGHVLQVKASSESMRRLFDDNNELAQLAWIPDKPKPRSVSVKSPPRPQPSRPPRFVPAPPLPATIPSATSAPSPPATLTLREPVRVRLKYGEATLPAGTKLQVMSRDGPNVFADYAGDKVQIPITATDL